jgi:hypothetical protein
MPGPAPSRPGRVSGSRKFAAELAGEMTKEKPALAELDEEDGHD